MLSLCGMCNYEHIEGLNDVLSSEAQHSFSMHFTDFFLLHKT